MNEAARSLTAPIDNNFLSGEKATKPQREQMISPWAEFSAFLHLSLFARGAWRQSGFKYPQSVRNHCKTAWQLREGEAICLCWEHGITQPRWSKGSGSGWQSPDLVESAWIGLTLTWAHGNDVCTGSNIAFSLED